MSIVTYRIFRGSGQNRSGLKPYYAQILLCDFLSCRLSVNAAPILQKTLCAQFRAKYQNFFSLTTNIVNFVDNIFNGYLNWPSWAVSFAVSRRNSAYSEIQ